MQMRQGSLNLEQHLFPQYYLAPTNGNLKVAGGRLKRPCFASFLQVHRPQSQPVVQTMTSRKKCSDQVSYIMAHSGIYTCNFEHMDFYSCLFVFQR